MDLELNLEATRLSELLLIVGFRPQIPTDGIITGRLQLAGPVSEPRIRILANLDRGYIDGYQKLQGQLEVEICGQVTTIHRIKFTDGEGTLAINGKYSPGRDFALNLAVRNFPCSHWEKSCINLCRGGWILPPGLPQGKRVYPVNWRENSERVNGAELSWPRPNLREISAMVCSMLSWLRKSSICPCAVGGRLKPNGLGLSDFRQMAPTRRRRSIGSWSCMSYLPGFWEILPWSQNLRWYGQGGG